MNNIVTIRHNLNVYKMRCIESRLAICPERYYSIMCMLNLLV